MSPHRFHCPQRSTADYSPISAGPAVRLALLALGCAAFAISGAAAWAQNSATNGPKPTTIGTPPTPTTNNGGKSTAGYSPFLPVAGDNSDAARAQRQQLLFVQFLRKNQEDTERLLALAKELDSVSEAAHRSTPTAEDVKKVEEIEKLAKRVKDRLTGP
jgi:ABC-type glycerol-3-phosphate transport system substrate-binding protein